jgi:hypothetical protein
VNYSDVSQLGGKKPPRPTDLIGESLCFRKIERLSLDLVWLASIERARDVGPDGGNLYARPRIGEPSAKLDVPARHAAEVWRVILRREQMPDAITAGIHAVFFAMAMILRDVSILMDHISCRMDEFSATTSGLRELSRRRKSEFPTRIGKPQSSRRNRADVLNRS